MITYNPKDWFKLIFQFHKSDTFRILFPNMILLGLLTGGLVFVETEIYPIHIKNFTIFHQILGFVLSMLLVFRINSAYDRWWEGRKLWGALLNYSRSLVLKVNAFVGESKEDKAELSNLVINFAYVLKNHLRGQVNTKELIVTPGLELSAFEKAEHKPSFIIALIYKKLFALNKAGKLSDEKLLLTNEEVRSFSEIAGACERIKSTPIPYSYSMFLKKIIFIYIITMPIPFSIDFSYWAIPMVMFIFYAFASIELISEEIEDPFGEDANDLPTQELAEKIKNNLDEMGGWDK